MDSDSCVRMPVQKFRIHVIHGYELWTSTLSNTFDVYFDYFSFVVRQNIYFSIYGFYSNTHYRLTKRKKKTGNASASLGLRFPTMVGNPS